MTNKRQELLTRISPKAMRVILLLTSGLLALVVIAFSWLHSEAGRLRNEQIPQQVHQQAELFRHRLDAFFAPVQDNLDALRKMAMDQTISLEKSAAKVTESVVLHTLDKPSLGISGFVLADTTGRELKWIHADHQWHKVASEYDIRTRQWFKDALQLTEPDDVLSSGVYTFHSRQKPGVTMAQSFRLEGRQEQYVIAFDVTLSDFALFVTNMKTADSAHLIFYQNNKIANLTEYAGMLPGTLPSEADFWKDLTNMKDSVAVAAVSTWVKEAAPQATALKFSEKGQTWWVEFLPLSPENSNTQAAVLIPEASMIQAARQSVISFFAATALALIGLVIVLVVLLRQQSRMLNEQLSYVGHIGKSAGQLLTTIAAGEGNNLEFKSTLRWHIKANKPAKEIEIACMKTLAAFLNSDGGTLLVGVEDNGNILGIEADSFPNEDKFMLHFNNLIKQHLGLECAPFIDFDVKRIEDHGVLVVDCRPSISPVFVTNGDKEDFFIRVGPGTRKLATSEVLAYINDHFN
jgi:hypothetical protein